jgi:hypothetical protein
MVTVIAQLTPYSSKKPIAHPIGRVVTLICSTQKIANVCSPFEMDFFLVILYTVAGYSPIHDGPFDLSKTGTNHQKELIIICAP